MSAQTLTRRRKQVRDFVLIWTGITIVMGACTFFAIYITYPSVVGSGAKQPNLALATATPLALGAAINATPIPTRQIVVASPTPQAQPPTAAPAQAVAQAQPTDAPTEAVPTATLLPIDDKAFHLAIQVQHSLDMNADNQDGWMREVNQKLGLDWYKQQVRWEEVQPERDQWNWAELDLTMPSAARFRVKVLLSIVTAPAWARESGVNVEKHGPPANNADYVNFVTELLKRYPGQVHAVEVWNEQNLDREWMSTKGLSAANYVALLRDTYTAIKAVDPGVIVISGALSPTGGWTEPDGRISAIDDFDYLTQMINAGVLNYADCIGAHHNGYNIGPNVPWDSVPNDPAASFRGPFENPHHSWSLYSTLNTYASKVKLAGGDQKLCVTEFGWASTEDLGGYPPGFEFANDNTLAEQKEWTIEAIQLMEDWDIVWIASLWNLNYGPQAGWATDNDNVPYSIIGKDWKFRPVYDALVAWHQERQQTGQ